MDPIHRFKESWIGAFEQPIASRPDEFPSYPYCEPESLVSTSSLESFTIGTGASIYTQSLLPAIAKAEREVILVTCFWASSSTLTALREALERLARLREDRIRRQHPAGDALTRLDIRICFSSRSFFQKLLHPWSRGGYTYPPSKWISKLGLPDPKLLEAGLINLQVKSLFFLPLSVIHPKFLIIDRQRAWLPSCNVSWEPWLEGCVEITGDAVATLIRFYSSVWDRHSEVGRQVLADDGLQQQANAISNFNDIVPIPIPSPASQSIAPRLDAVPTILLPSSHHRNPRFHLLPWQRSPHPPATPLNCAVLCLFAMAEKKIYVQTPNLTSATVTDALLEALNRGVEVTIVTSKGMMIWEQLLTSGTTTSRCLRSFIKAYKQQQKRLKSSTRVNDNEGSNLMLDPEAQWPKLGSLEVFYFHPLPENQLERMPEEPVHSHLKLTMIDEEYAVLGSGNMDRASWFTSQELGILFQSSEFAANVSNVIDQTLRNRRSIVFSSKQ
ncbi:putative phospholipase D nuclease [Rosellinia necatrix]|uniref:Putative phospholipase D nuclease n=1 Tax=Rosellinia necatrix TaxID=77044 RepID=A0A1W2TXC5_ROSNE|nr:putative phospholipase D nuclease [Rosellinia necatrix]